MAIRNIPVVWVVVDTDVCRQMGDLSASHATEVGEAILLKLEK